MSLYLGPPIALAPTSLPQVIPFPEGPGGNLVTGVKLANASSLTLNIFLGGALIDSLDPFLVNVYSLQPDFPNRAGATPCPPLTYATVGIGEAGDNLTPTWAFYGDQFQGSYPVPLPPVTQVAGVNQIVPGDNIVVNPSSGTGAVTVSAELGNASAVLGSDVALGTSPTLVQALAPIAVGGATSFETFASVTLENTGASAANVALWVALAAASTAGYVGGSALTIPAGAWATMCLEYLTAQSGPNVPFYLNGQTTGAGPVVKAAGPFGYGGATFFGALVLS